jgi:hypothetical protein
VLQKLREVFCQNWELTAHSAGEEKVFPAEFETNDFEKLGKLGQKGHVEAASPRQARNENQRLSYPHFHRLEGVGGEAVSSVGDLSTGYGLPVSG